MRNDFHQWGREQWYSPGDIVEDLHRHHYRVYAIECEDQWYSVNAFDLQGERVELKVSPKTRKVFSWIIRSGSCKNQNREERKRREDEIAGMSKSIGKVSQEVVCLREA
ncbi:PepSY domain-containing protein [Candidatus Nitrospira salsa]